MISDEQLRFVPREGMWSLGTAARHIANAEDGWFRYMATRNLDEWPAFAQGEISTVAEVKKRLTEVRSWTEALLSSVDTTQVERIVQTPWEARFPL